MVPGVILCEILAQSACVLLAAGAAEGPPLLHQPGQGALQEPGEAGDVFETTCTLVKAKGPFYFCTGKGTVNGKLCVTADFSFALVGK